MFGPNALWHSLAGRVSEESGKGQEQQERESERERERKREIGKESKRGGIHTKEDIKEIKRYYNITLKQKQ